LSERTAGRVTVRDDSQAFLDRSLEQFGSGGQAAEAGQQQ
jgi:hypothetical protein